MPGYYGLIFACPYYRSDDKGKILCEGGIVRMHSSSQTRRYATDYCCSVDRWASCSIARALTAYYERRENDGRSESEKNRAP